MAPPEPAETPEIEARLTAELGELAARGLLRVPLEARGEAADLVSNDYLGLRRDPRLARGAREALEAEGSGAGAARLLGGDLRAHAAAERAAAQWLGAEAALLFPSGWQANLGLVTTLVGRGDALVCDALLHASLIDGARLSRARRLVHRHLDLEGLERALVEARGARRRVVLTEGVFSMDGDAPDLARVDELCARHDAWLVVDEAHSVGLVGPRGAGAVAAAEARAGRRLGRVVARVVTGGKALGSAGALVVGSATLRALLWNRARAFVFTTAVAPSVAGSLAAGIAAARGADEERAHVCALARRTATALGLPEPAAAIVPVPVGDAARALRVAETLRDAGLDVRAVRPPTVPPGTARLRVVWHADNDVAQVEALVRGLRAEGLPVAAPASGPNADEGADAGHDGSHDLARAVWVLGTDTGVGKTVVSAAVTRALHRAGHAVRYWKPVQTGDESDTDEVGRLTADLDLPRTAPTHAFPLPASPHEAAAAAGGRVEPARLADDLSTHLAACERLVVEPAGGLHVPLTDDWRTADWVARDARRVVLVARSGLGTLNHTLLTLEALAARGLRPRALVLVGEPHPSNRATLARAFGGPVLELPPLPELTPGALDHWLERQPLAEALEGTAPERDR